MDILSEGKVGLRVTQAVNTGEVRVHEDLIMPRRILNNPLPVL